MCTLSQQVLYRGQWHYGVRSGKGTQWFQTDHSKHTGDSVLNGAVQLFGLTVDTLLVGGRVAFRHVGIHW